MAEAKKTTKKVNSKQSTADSKTEKKLSTVNRKLSTKADPKEAQDGIIEESVTTEIQAVEEHKKVDSKQLTADSKTEGKKEAELSTVDSKLLTEESKAPAKAGKRSAKAVAETEEKQAKVERLAKSAAASSEGGKGEAKPKQVQNTTTQLERKSKGFRKSAELIEAGKSYSLADALELATKTSHVKFDATVELHVRLGVDPRQADQNLRDIVVLPAGTGKTVRIAVLADAEGVVAAKKAGADIAGSEEFLQQLDKGTIDFDVLISTPQMMAKLSKYARLLGPKGLMPNPKSGTVTADVTKGVSDAKAGRVEYRVDSTGIVHLGVGKVSFGKDKLVQNTSAVLASIKGNKPGGLKGTFVKAIHVTTSMGPSITVETSEL